MRKAFRLDDFLPYRLAVAATTVSRAFSQRYASEFGLSIPEWRVLAILGSYAPLSSHEIVERSAMDKAKVSRAVARLTASGHLKRAVDPDDQRLLRLDFTKKGRSVYQAIVPRAEALAKELTAGLTASEAARLQDQLLRLSQRAADLEAGANPKPDRKSPSRRSHRE